MPLPLRPLIFGLALLVGLGTPLLSAAPAAAAYTVDLTVPGVRYVSQLSEPAPSGWRGTAPTPYCAAASSLAVMESFGLVDPPNPLLTLYSIAQRGNALRGEEGLDPAGVSSLMRFFGGEGRVHMYTNKSAALTELVGRLNAGVPVVIFAEAGFHAEVVYGYQAIAGGGPLTGIYAQDPITGFRGLVPVSDFTSQYHWWGSAFGSAGNLWRGNYVFVSFREYPGGVTPTMPNTYHSAWAAQSDYPVLAFNQVATVFVQVQNTGTAVWTKGTASELHIGVVGDDKTLTRLGVAQGWLWADRPAAQTEAVVSPGQTATFTFQVKGVAFGGYPLKLRPVVEGVAWLEDQGIYMLIMVR